MEDKETRRTQKMTTRLNLGGGMEDRIRVPAMRKMRKLKELYGRE